MAFNAINSNEIEVGDPVTADLMTKIKDNFDDHENRISDFEGAAVIPVFNALVVMNTSDPDLTGKAYFTAPCDFTISSCYIQIFTKGTMTGSLEIDIAKAATLGAAYTSIFTTKPKITMASAADYDKSTNQVFAAGQAVTAGEILRVDLTSIPGTVVATKFLIVCTGDL
jgi:hypothetical protein